MNSAILAFLGTLAGAAIALAGQHWMGKRENRTRQAELLLDQCSKMVALCEDFLNRAWEENVLSLTHRVDEWDLAGHRHAMATIKLLSTDARLVSAVDHLHKTGSTYGAYWRRGEIDPVELRRLRDENKAALSDFVAVSAEVLRRQFGAA